MANIRKMFHIPFKKRRILTKNHLFNAFSHFLAQKTIFSVILGQLLPEVPILDVVVETNAVGAAEQGNNLKNLVLLLW